MQVGVIAVLGICIVNPSKISEIKKQLICCDCMSSMAVIHLFLRSHFRGCQAEWCPPQQHGQLIFTICSKTWLWRIRYLQAWAVAWMVEQFTMSYYGPFRKFLVRILWRTICLDIAIFNSRNVQWGDYPMSVTLSYIDQCPHNMGTPHLQHAFCLWDWFLVPWRPSHSHRNPPHILSWVLDPYCSENL